MDKQVCPDCEFVGRTCTKCELFNAHFVVWSYVIVIILGIMIRCGGWF